MNLDGAEAAVLRLGALKAERRSRAPISSG